MTEKVTLKGQTAPDCELIGVGLKPIYLSSCFPIDVQG